MRRTFYNKTYQVLVVLAVFFFILHGSIPQKCFAQSAVTGEPYVAPPYEPPPLEESKVHLVDNGDGTITSPDTGLMWTQKDSYSDLGRCLDWHESGEYVKQLRTGGYADWKMPSLQELATIYDSTKDSVIGWDHDERFPMRISELFAVGAAYWVWASDHMITDLTECCAMSFYFVKGMVHIRRFTMCSGGGVRAVRDARKKPE